MYTTLNNPETNRDICRVVEIIKDEIVKNTCPKSIVLKGSFGKGEVTAIKKNKLEFLSDCEVLVIPDKQINRKELLQMSSKLTQQTGLKVELSDLDPELKFCVRFGLWNKLLPTIDNYDLKYGSRTIYGDNFLEVLPAFKPEEIPIWEGIRLIFNRMMESMQYFSIEYLNKYPTKEAEQELFFWINKLILACQDALLILANEYHYSYNRRNKIFQKIFRNRFKSLDEEVPELLSLTIKATAYKLAPENMYYSNVIEFWFDIVEITDKIFRYIIKKDMSIEFCSYTQFQELYLRHPYIKKKYYRGLTPNTIYQNMRSAVKMRIFEDKTPPIKLLRRALIPWTHIVYSTIPIIFFSLSRGGNLDETALKNVGEISLQANLIYSDLNQSQLWEYTKKQALGSWRAICY